jgi:HEPN domain-containing protein
MSDPKHARHTLAIAEEDLAMAREMLTERFPDRGFGFHVQQAVEKALKA